MKIYACQNMVIKQVRWAVTCHIKWFPVWYFGSFVADASIKISPLFGTSSSSFINALPECLFCRQGSIVVDFQLIFETRVTVKEALAPLKTETADGKLGSLRVDPDSIKPKLAKQGKLMQPSI